MTSVDMERARRESLRWVVLQSLNYARPSDAPEHILLRIAQESEYGDCTQLELRRALDYLAERDLVVVEKGHLGPWRAKLTRYGIDVVEYTIECEPGIARPRKYWNV